MAKYRVTGGADGVAGIVVKGRRYEPGDTVELTGSAWLVEQGYLTPAAKTTTRAAAAVASDEEE